MYIAIISNYANLHKIFLINVSYHENLIIIMIIRNPCSIHAWAGACGSLRRERGVMLRSLICPGLSQSLITLYCLGLKWPKVA